MLNKRLQILAMFIGTAAFLLLTAGHDSPHEEAAPIAVVAPQVASNSSNASPEMITLSGTLSVVYGDQNVEGFGTSPASVAMLQGDGFLVSLVDYDAGALRLYNGDSVTVTGQWADADPMRVGDAPVLDVERMTQVADSFQDSVTGNEKWLNIACRFGDMTDETPQPLSYFEDMMLNEAPGMDHYWRQTSAGLVNIEGSASYGWFDLPKDKSHYLRMSLVNTGFALRSLLTDCAQALAQADDSVDFNQFGGINIMLNDTFGCCAWGGRMALNVDGTNVMFRTTWLPPWAFNSLHVIAHEMGHGWGLPHSSGPYGAVYDSAWDVMSGGTRMLDLCRIGQEKLGCYQVGTIGYHLAMLGWISEERVVSVDPGESAVITLDALTTVQSGMDALLIKVPVDRSQTFYTVEARSFIGYDRNVPGEAVVLHEVQPGRSSPAHVVDADGNGNPNDEGAMWLPGESFTSGNITIEVLSKLGNTFTVRVSNGG